MSSKCFHCTSRSNFGDGPPPLPRPASLPFVFPGPRQKPRWRFDLPPCAVTHPAGSPCERVLGTPHHRGLGGVTWTLLKPRSPLPASKQVLPQPNLCSVARMLFLKVRSNQLTPHLPFLLALCCPSIEMQTSTLLASPRGPAILVP